MKSKRKTIKAFLLLLACCFLHSTYSFAQFLGFTSPQTVEQIVFNAVVAPQASAAGLIPNLGQTVHYLVYTTAGTITKLSIQLEGSVDGTNWIRISDTASDTLTGGVFANIYLPFIRANLTTLTGGGSVTASYTGTSVSAGAPAGVFATSGVNNKTLAVGAPANTTVTYTVDPPRGNSSGVITFKYSAALAGGTLGVTGGPDTSHLAVLLSPITLANSNAVQIFTVGGSPANVLQVTYTAPGATAVTYDAYYAFGSLGNESFRARSSNAYIGLTSVHEVTIANISGQGAGQLNAVGCAVESTALGGSVTAVLNINVDGKGTISLPFIAGTNFENTGAGIFITNAASSSVTAGTRLVIPYNFRFANTISISINVTATTATAGALYCVATYGTVN